MERIDYIAILYQGYLAHTLSEKEQAELLDFFDTCSDAELQYVVGSLSSESDTVVPVSAAQEARAQQVFHRVAAVTQPRIRRINTWRYLAVAAVCVLALSFGFYFWRANQVTQLFVTAAGGGMQEVVLPDGSQVWLNAGATLSYPEKFKANQRVVTLTDGQAYFEIAPNEEQPFTVDAGSVSVQVLGTSFEVTAFKSVEQASVSVKTGKVNVIPTTVGLGGGMALTAKQKAIVYTTTGSIETAEIDPSDVAGWKDNRLVFSADDFATVLEALQRKYGVAIDLQKQGLRQKRITLRLDDQPLETVLKALSISNQFTYDIANDSTVVIR